MNVPVKGKQTQEEAELLPLNCTCSCEQDGDSRGRASLYCCPRPGSRSCCPEPSGTPRQIGTHAGPAEDKPKSTYPGHDSRAGERKERAFNASLLSKKQQQFQCAPKLQHLLRGNNVLDWPREAGFSTVSRHTSERQPTGLQSTFLTQPVKRSVWLGRLEPWLGWHSAGSRVGRTPSRRRVGPLRLPWFSCSGPKGQLTTSI